MISKIKELYKILAELVYLLVIKDPYTEEDHERTRILTIDLHMFLFEFWGNIIVCLLIGFYVVFFINMLCYCWWQDDYSVEAVQRYVKYEVLGIDPVAEQKRLAHEALKEKHRQAAEFYRLQELAKKKPPLE
jgi:hypothetical protein